MTDETYINVSTTFLLKNNKSTRLWTLKESFLNYAPVSENLNV
jgi:hypothetical protein